jgi:hypothetical protein
MDGLPEKEGIQMPYCGSKLVQGSLEPLLLERGT